MRKMLRLRKALLLSACIIFTNVVVAQLTQQWAARYNGTANGSDDARSLVVDNNGNVYVTGTVTDTVSGLDIRTIKYNAEGRIIWKAKWNGSANGDDEPYSIAVDKYGNAYVTGRSMGNGTGFDFVTVKYNVFGIRQWSARYSTPGNTFDWAKSVAVDDQGNVYVTGEGGLGPNLTSDYITIKYNTNGTRLWVANYDGPGRNDGANALTLDEYGNVYVTGRSPAGIDLDEEDMDMTTVKYNTNGVQQWVARYDGPVAGNFFDQGQAITVDKYGNVYVTGNSAGSNLEDAADYATVKYNANGVQQWAARYNGPGNSTDVPLAIAVDASQNVYITGYSAAAPNETNYDYATIKYNSSGQQLWLSRYNGPANDHDQANGLALDKDANVYVTGRSIGIGTGFDFATVKYNTAGDQQTVVRYNGPANGYDGPTIFISPSHPIAVDKNCNVYITGASAAPATATDMTTIKYFPPSAPPAPTLIPGTTTQPAANSDPIPTNFRIFVAPNPAVSTTKISYELPVDGKVTITIYDILGRRIETLVDATKPAGSYFADFNLTTIATGMYTYQFIVKSSEASWIQTGRISVIK